MPGIGMNFAKTWLTERPATEVSVADEEMGMTYSRYDDPDFYWENRLRRALRGREGFAWGAFLIGFILGGIIF